MKDNPNSTYFQVLDQLVSTEKTMNQWEISKKLGKYMQYAVEQYPELSEDEIKRIFLEGMASGVGLFTAKNVDMAVDTQKTINEFI